MLHIYIKIKRKTYMNHQQLLKVCILITCAYAVTFSLFKQDNDKLVQSYEHVLNKHLNYMLILSVIDGVSCSLFSYLQLNRSKYFLLKREHVFVKLNLIYNNYNFVTCN